MHFPTCAVTLVEVSTTKGNTVQLTYDPLPLLTTHCGAPWQSMVFLESQLMVKRLLHFRKHQICGLIIGSTYFQNFNVSKFLKPDMSRADTWKKCLDSILWDMLEEGLHAHIILKANGGFVRVQRTVLASVAPVLLLSIKVCWNSWFLTDSVLWVQVGMYSTPQLVTTMYWC